MSPAPMPADKETGRQVRMFAAVSDDKYVPVNPGSVFYYAKQARAYLAGVYEGHGGWNGARKAGWRIVPIIVTIEDKANAR